MKASRVLITVTLLTATTTATFASSRSVHAATLPPVAPSVGRVCFPAASEGTQVTGTPFTFTSAVTRGSKSYPVIWKYSPVWCASSLSRDELTFRSGWGSAVTGVPAKVTRAELAAAFKKFDRTTLRESWVIRDTRNRVVATKFVASDTEQLRPSAVQVPGTFPATCRSCSWYGSRTGSKALTGPSVFVDLTTSGTWCVAADLSWRQSVPSAIVDTTVCPVRKPLRWSSLPPGRYRVEFTATVKGASTMSTGRASVTVPARP